MNYIILGYRTDGTVSELFRTGNKTEAKDQFDITPKHSFASIKLVQELKVK